jgi:hypothetical protein
MKEKIIVWSKTAMDFLVDHPTLRGFLLGVLVGWLLS